MQRVVGFQANLNLMKQTFRKRGVPGCVEVVRTAIPAIHEKINAAIADGMVVDKGWRQVFIAKAADELIAIRVPKAQVLDFKKQAAEALGLKI